MSKSIFLSVVVANLIHVSKDISKMNLVTYPLIISKDYKRYEFLSEGPKGKIKKVVLYQPMGEYLYNLSFGDWDETRQAINDSMRSNNNDRNKVVATVAFTVIEFIKHYPDVLVLAKGSTSSRTRLYQIGISVNWHIIGQQFHVRGFYNGAWEPFVNGRNYQAFFIGNPIENN